MCVFVSIVTILTTVLLVSASYYASNNCDANCRITVCYNSQRYSCSCGCNCRVNKYKCALVLVLAMQLALVSGRENVIHFTFVQHSNAYLSICYIEQPNPRSTTIYLAPPSTSRVT